MQLAPDFRGQVLYLAGFMPATTFYTTMQSPLSY